MRENTYIKIETLYRKYRGYVETKNLLAEGFSNRQISTLVNEGYLQKVCYGHYWLSGKQCKKPFDYKCIEVSLSNPDAVICMNSALYYQGVLSAEPDYLSVATERTDRSMMKMLLDTEGEFICYSDKTSDDAVFVRTDEQGTVLEFSRESGDYEWTGPACICKRNLVYSSQNVFNMFESHLPMRGIKVRAYDIDTYNDYLRVSELTKDWKI
jgi:hypothetical protein